MATITVPGLSRRLRVGKVLGLGKNYAEHAREMGATPSPAPVIFIKPATALLAAGRPIRLPSFSTCVHYEVEVVLAIGRRCKSVPPEKASAAIAACTVGLDLTARDVQAEAKAQGNPWAVAKGFDGSACVAPWVPWPTDRAPDALEITLHINGVERQRGSTSDMICPLTECVSYCSRYFTLERGDLIFTGTPSGVGPIAAGDRLDIELVGLTAATFPVAG